MTPVNSSTAIQVKDFPLDPLLKSSKAGRKRESKDSLALAGKLLEYKPLISPVANEASPNPTSSISAVKRHMITHL